MDIYGAYKMNINNVNAKAMREIADEAFENNTEKLLNRILASIEKYAKGGERSYKQGFYSSYFSDLLDTDYIVKELKRRGFKVKLERTLWFVGDVERIIVSW